MANECLICGAPLEYPEEEVLAVCQICHKEEHTKARCVNGHYVCDACHRAGTDRIIALCLQEKGTDPIAILEQMMSMDFCHMHGPEHHVLVGAALLTAYHNAGGKLELEKALFEMHRRGSEVPGGVCGFWGACGAGISSGIFVSIATKSTPLAEEAWSLSNRMTAASLAAISKAGGPRCCKRDSYLAILTAAEFAKEHLGVEMTPSAPRCSRSHMNAQCRKENCPFYQG